VCVCVCMWPYTAAKRFTGNNIYFLNHPLFCKGVTFISGCKHIYNVKTFIIQIYAVLLNFLFKDL